MTYNHILLNNRSLPHLHPLCLHQGLYHLNLRQHSCHLLNHSIYHHESEDDQGSAGTDYSSSEDTPQDNLRFRPKRALRLPPHLKQYVLDSPSDEDSKY